MTQFSKNTQFCLVRWWECPYEVCGNRYLPKYSDSWTKSCSCRQSLYVGKFLTSINSGAYWRHFRHFSPVCCRRSRINVSKYLNSKMLTAIKSFSGTWCDKLWKYKPHKMRMVRSFCVIQSYPSIQSYPRWRYIITKRFSIFMTISESTNTNTDTNTNLPLTR